MAKASSKVEKVVVEPEPIIDVQAIEPASGVVVEVAPVASDVGVGGDVVEEPMVKAAEPVVVEPKAKEVTLADHVASAKWIGNEGFIAGVQLGSAADQDVLDVMGYRLVRRGDAGTIIARR